MIERGRQMKISIFIKLQDMISHSFAAYVDCHLVDGAFALESEINKGKKPNTIHKVSLT